MWQSAQERPLAPRPRRRRSKKALAPRVTFSQGSPPQSSAGMDEEPSVRAAGCASWAFRAREHVKLRLHTTIAKMPSFISELQTYKRRLQSGTATATGKGWMCKDPLQK